MFRFLALLTCVAAAVPATAAPVERAGSAALPTGDSGDVRERLSGWRGPPAPVIGDALAPPVMLGRLSSGFGVRVDPLGRGSRVHEGIDVPGVAGTPVHAAADGIVAVARAVGGYGNLVEIDHGNGLRTRYGHLLAIAVAPGTMVRSGEVVGLMGSTGRSTGSHLHFEVRLHGRPADPLERLDSPARAIAAPSPVTPHGGGWTTGEGLPIAQLR